MCGIAGWAGPSTSGTHEAEITRAITALHHRGPDASAVKILHGDRSAVLGAVRLRIRDLSSAADQPLSSPDGMVWVSFNGELYNEAELRHKLIAAGHRFRTQTDTECLVHLYEDVDGDPHRMLPQLRGMFSFAIWDTRRGRLLLARDRLGIKPLVYVRSGSGIYFASEVRALLSAGVVSDAEPAALGPFLAWGSLPSGRSIVAGVQNLAPGHFLSWDGSEHVERWWAPSYVPHPELNGPDQAREQLRAALEDSVSRHLVADRTVGLFLSSGVDSGAIATLAAAAGSQRALTVTFPEASDLDETDGATEIARELGIAHEVVPVRSADIGDLFPSFLKSLDHPTVDGFNTWIVCRAASETGLVVALLAWGATSCSAGIPPLPMRRPWPRFSRRCRSFRRPYAHPWPTRRHDGRPAVDWRGR